MASANQYKIIFEYWDAAEDYKQFLYVTLNVYVIIYVIYLHTLTASPDLLNRLYSFYMMVVLILLRLVIIYMLTPPKAIAPIIFEVLVAACVAATMISLDYSLMKESVSINNFRVKETQVIHT
ncbi:hypothetical protein RI129_008975 [Pyrocoelia pectoralis]|uniref:Uncharacterized protein n=1 Tax=Pyrocoelia pectoralis TaxID=417401 RepID=A0AAN7V9L3_9COLE